MQEEEIDRVVDPHDLLAAQRRLAAFDPRAVGIRHESAAFEAAAQAHAFQLRIDLGEIDDDEIVGHAVDRDSGSGRSACGCRAAAARNSR